MSEVKTLARKMLNIMKAVDNVAKNGRNDFHKYDYATEADVLKAIRTALITEGVVIYSSVFNSHKDGEITTLMLKHTIKDADSGEQIEVSSLGQGADKSDKGVYKAYTGAMKYMLLKNFLLPTGDDPESSDNTGKTTGSAKPTLATVAASPKKAGFSNKPPIAAAAVKQVEEEESEF